MRHVQPSWTTTLTDGRRVHIVTTERRHGDLAVGQDAAVVEARRRAVVDAPWVWLKQVHGTRVVTATSAGDRAGRTADAAVTSVTAVPIAVHVADCAPVALVDPGGVIGVAHAGWRGLVGGVLDETVDAMARLGATAPVAVLGPCIRPRAYEFGQADLDVVADALGEPVRSTTATGAPALDIPAAVEAALARLDVELVADVGGCTAAEHERRWSHRARSEQQRQALVAWIAAS